MVLTVVCVLLVIGWCWACPRNCQKCTNNQCVQCMSGYNVSRIGECTRCASGYFDSTFSSCLKCEDPCVECVSFHRCTFCASSQYLYEGDCLPCHRGCAVCTRSGCTSCLDGFYMHNYSCYPCPIKCAECVTQLCCTTCSPTYYRMNEDCVPCSPSCLTCSSVTGECTSCQEKHYLINGTCVQCPPHCSSCKGLSGECLKGCLTGYNKLGIACGRCNEYCRVCLNETTCTECTEGHYLKALGDGYVVCSPCEDTCSSCVQSTCIRQGGCTTGTWGPDCQYPCSSLCSPASCERDSGYCSVCSSFTYGGFCEHNCSLFCSHNGCARNTGNCHDCQQFRYGDECQYYCPLNCRLVEGIDTCNRTNGECLHGCQNYFDGPFCSVVIDDQRSEDVASGTAVIWITAGTAFIGIINGIITLLVFRVLLRKRQTANNLTGQQEVPGPSVIYINTSNMEDITSNFNCDCSIEPLEVSVASEQYISIDVENIDSNVNSDPSTGYPEITVPLAAITLSSENITGNVDSNNSTGNLEDSVYINTSNSDNITGNVDSENPTGHTEISAPSVDFINTSNLDNINENLKMSWKNFQRSAWSAERSLQMKGLDSSQRGEGCIRYGTNSPFTYETLSDIVEENNYSIRNDDS